MKNKIDIYEEQFIPNVNTLEMTDSNDIHFPFEWFLRLGFVTGFVQITLIDDRIVIHKPTAVNTEYKSPYKAIENSYIRSAGLFSIRIPKQLFKALDINGGDKIDLTLEENCISIRKHPAVESKCLESIAPDPIMAFCCVCGKLLYTEELVKLMSKYICSDCINADILLPL